MVNLPTIDMLRTGQSINRLRKQADITDGSGNGNALALQGSIINFPENANKKEKGLRECTKLGIIK